MMWFDVGIVFLLIIAIGFCFILSDRLKSLKIYTGSLGPSMQKLNEVLQKAAQSIGTLKAISDTSHEGINKYLPTAQATRDDLVLLIEHADRLSYRLDSLIDKATAVEKDLKQTLLVSIRQEEKRQANQSIYASSYGASPYDVDTAKNQPINNRAGFNNNFQTNEKSHDPRDVFVTRVSSGTLNEPRTPLSSVANVYR